LQIKVFVPSHSKAIYESIAKELCEYFGGCTIYQNCHGFWHNIESNTLEHDKITVIEIFTTHSESLIQRILKPRLKHIKESLKQNCVAYSINDTMYFYE